MCMLIHMHVHTFAVLELRMSMEADKDASLERLFGYWISGHGETWVLLVGLKVILIAVWNTDEFYK